MIDGVSIISGYKIDLKNNTKQGENNMTSNELWENIRHNNMKRDEVNNPIKIDNFIYEIYSSMKERDFSIIQADEIVKSLSYLIENDKKLILREPLKTVTKYNKEG